jgi:Protein of unknown function (DUF2971)
LNDSSEIEYGHEMLDAVLDEWIEANQKGTSCAVELLKTVRAWSNRGSENPTDSVFVACFCEEGNLLSQWRAYGREGGYSIEVHAGQGNVHGLKAESDSFSKELAQVIYEPERQARRLHHILSEVLPIANESEVGAKLASAPHDIKEGIIGALSIILYETLTDELVRFKNPAFAEEKEWRIVVRPNMVRILDGMNSSGARVHFRAGRGLFIPYVKLIPTGNKLPIRSVRFGPSLEKKKAEGSLNAFFTIHGYRDIGVYGSEIPVIL